MGHPWPWRPTNRRWGRGPSGHENHAFYTLDGTLTAGSDCCPPGSATACSNPPAPCLPAGSCPEGCPIGKLCVPDDAGGAACCALMDVCGAGSDIECCLDSQQCCREFNSTATTCVPGDAICCQEE